MPRLPPQVSYMTQHLGFLAANAQRFAQSLDLIAAAEASKVRTPIYQGVGSMC